MLVRALCAVKLTASDRSWPHMRGAGRSRFAPRIGHHRGYRAVAWRAGISGGRSRIRTCDGSLTSGLNRAAYPAARDQNRSLAGALLRESAMRHLCFAAVRADERAADDDEDLEPAPLHPHAGRGHL